jgi:hypothetical protein
VKVNLLDESIDPRDGEYVECHELSRPKEVRGRNHYARPGVVCRKYFREQKITSDSSSGGHLEQRSDELRLIWLVK